MALAVCDSLRRAIGPADPGAVVRRLEGDGVRTLASHTHGHHYPHLSYAVLRSWDLSRVQAGLADLPDAGPFSMSFHGTLASRGAGRPSPRPSPPTSPRRQQQVVSAVVETGADLHRNYRPGNWVPHVSVATRPPWPRVGDRGEGDRRCAAVDGVGRPGRAGRQRHRRELALGPHSLTRREVTCDSRRMRTLLNVLWLVLAGFWLCVGYVLLERFGA